MFETKPTSISAELREVREVFDGQDLASAADRSLETISRWSHRERFPARIERFIDDLWVATAIVSRELRDPRAVRFVLVARREELDWRSAIEVIFRRGLHETLPALARIAAEVKAERGAEPPQTTLPLRRLPAAGSLPAPGSRTVRSRAVNPASRRAARAAFLRRSRTKEGIDADALADLRETPAAA